MITKMNKLTLLIYHKEYTDFLERLREIGVVHITQRENGAAEDSALEELLALSNRYKRVIKRLEACAVEEYALVGNTDVAATILDEYDSAVAKIEDHKTLQQVVEKDITTLEPWGEFSFETIDRLTAAGYNVNFFISNARNFDPAWVEKYNAIVVADRMSRKYFVTVTPAGVEVDIDAEPARLPSASLSQLKEENERVAGDISKAVAALDELAASRLETLREAHKQLLGKIEFSKVALDGEKVSGDKLLLLEGWVPVDATESLKNMLDNSGVFYEIRAARRGDNCPVKLKNNAFTRMYEVLTKMYGMPSGTDFDPTPVLAPFFSLFFAFCVGDAGYGLVLVLLGMLLKKKLGKDMAALMNLVMTLGVFTAVIGTLLGTFFGMSIPGLIAHFQGAAPTAYEQYFITGNMEVFGSVYQKQMVLALLIGVVHISIAMTVKAINSTVFFGFKESLSAWGWWLAVVGGVVLGALSALSIIPAEVSKWALIAVGLLSALGIYVLNNLRRNVFANIGAGLWDTYNMASGLLGDILSYIRLFALCLAGGKLGETFNNLAYDLIDGKDGAVAVVGWIGFVLIIVLGHTLNIAMSCLSAYVHPLRLTFVEYFKNAGYEGKGMEYKPFKNK